MVKRLALHISRQPERVLRTAHPWLFEGAIERQNQEGAAGDLAVVFDHRNRFLAIGLYDPDSPIRVRVLQHHTPATIDAAWFADRIAAAVARRAPLATSMTDGYRLIHGENDGLPGLIVDRYADTLVIKLYSAAWVPHLDAVLAGLERAQPAARAVLRLSRQMQGVAHHLTDGQIMTGPPLDEPLIFRENGLRFYADVIHGHKTGFFFDQRDNRALAATFAPGRQVLDVFAYAGAFSLYAAAAGARGVLSVDVSAPALADAERNFALNRDHAGVAGAAHTTLVADAFAGLRQLKADRRQFELVIVDPPAFAKRGDEVARALAAYGQLTALALALLAPGGVFVMASCSSRVNADSFFAQVEEVAQAAGHRLEVLHRTGHALDHPIGFAEGAYLNCLFARLLR